MKRTEFNEKLREHARKLSPTEKERALITAVYGSFNDLLGDDSCIQIGSYPRQTATTPVHDLDILYVAGDWHEDWPTDSFTPSEAIADLKSRIENDFECPENCQVVSVDAQTHSVSVTLKCNGLEFSIDVVPAYTIDTNEFGDPTYRVPEVVKKKSHTDRASFYKQKSGAHESVGWIDSDPRGYISVASQVGENPDFRKAVKLVKHWKNNLEDEDGQLKLKSFHLEQVITQMFLANPDLELFDAIFGFFVDLPDTVLVANQIEDRANAGVYIDDYIAKFTAAQIEKIRQARDGLLIMLEEFDAEDSIEDLLSINFRKRRDVVEEYLFDQRIPMLVDEAITISAWIQSGGQDSRRLGAQGVIDNGYHLRFEVSFPVQVDLYKWKVKNDDGSPQPRGEITDHQTKNAREHTKYRGRHYVDCYAIKNGVCIARARQNVVLAHGD